MLQRLVYIERFAVLGGCALGPLLACVQIFRGQTELSNACMILAICVASGAIAGALIGILIHRVLALGSVQWGGHEETSALIKLAIGELISNKPDSKLNNDAMTQANAQEGRATSIYLFNRANNLRQQGVLSSGKRNPVSGTKRLIWACITLLLGSTAALLPAALPNIGLHSDITIVGILLLMPIWLTGLALAGLGIESADSWPSKLIPGKRPPKLRPRSTKSTAGRWHNKSSRSDVPVLRLVLLTPLIIAAGLYLLREYGPSPSYSSVQIDSAFTEAEPTAAPAPPERTATPAQAIRETATAAPTAQAQSQQATQTQKAMQVWSYLPDNGSLLQADRETLTYAGWDIDAVSATLDQAKQRINRWHSEHLRNHPDTVGKIALQLTLQPSGRISGVDVLAAEFNDPVFINGLRDRLEAVAFTAGAIDPVQVVLSMDFRP